jgi:hypothetical protein
MQLQGEPYSNPPAGGIRRPASPQDVVAGMEGRSRDPAALDIILCGTMVLSSNGTDRDAALIQKVHDRLPFDGGNAIYSPF